MREREREREKERVREREREIIKGCQDRGSQWVYTVGKPYWFFLSFSFFSCVPEISCPSKSFRGHRVSVQSWWMHIFSGQPIHMRLCFEVRLYFSFPIDLILIHLSCETFDVSGHTAALLQESAPRIFWKQNEYLFQVPIYIYIHTYIYIYIYVCVCVCLNVCVYACCASLFFARLIQNISNQLKKNISFLMQFC